MKSFFTALLITTISSFAQQPRSLVLWQGNLLEIKAMKPATPSTLARGENLTVTIHYNNSGQNAVRIFARPYTSDQKSGLYHAHPSPEYATGSGEVEGYFSFFGPMFVDEVRVTMVDTITEQVIAITKLPVQLTWE